MIPGNIALIRDHLRRGGVIAYATESCFGLGCDPLNFKAVKKLLRIKARRQAKGLILIAGKPGQLRPYCELPPFAELSRFWPGPFTLLFPALPRAPKWLTGGREKIAVRLTAHRDAADLCNALGMALVSTSANRSGMKAAKKASQCRFGDEVLVVPGMIGKRKKPSTILDFADGRILRQ